LFVYLLILFFVLFLCLISFLSLNIIVWWNIFLLITIIFILLNKESNNYKSIINYFIIQESLGLLFLLLNLGFLQFFFIMLKVGVAPFHFWVFSIVDSVSNLNFLWFLTFQKLPFLIMLMQIFISIFFLFLFFGFVSCYYQIFFIRNFKSLLMISSTESFSWILFGLNFSIFNSLYLFFIYIFTIIFLILKVSGYFFSINWEIMLIFINIPFSVTFFVKIFSLSLIFNYSFLFFYFILILILISSIAFRLWLIYMCSKMADLFRNFNMFFYLLIPIILILIFYFSSKIYYIILIR